MCSHQPKSKVLVMLVTLISFYYHRGCYLIISCSFLNCGAIASATVYNGAELHYHQHNYRDLDQDDDQHHKEKQKHSNSQLSDSQANDIFTKLTQPQGRINDDNQVDNEAINGGSWDGVEFRKDKDGNHLSTSQQTSGTSMSCKDEDGKDVNWFIAYKLPQVAGQEPLLTNGSKYYYLLPSASEWTPSDYPIHGSNSILATTLSSLWSTVESKEDFARIFYNDQPPSQPAIVMNGHTKGLILTTPQSGFWLQHSCPHFPKINSTNFSASYPPGGLINGQMFFCMSLRNATDVDVLGNVLQYTKPYIYNHSIPTTMEDILPQLAKLAEKNATIKKAPWYNTYNLQVGDKGVKIFAKGPKFRKEIYADWIAPEYATSLDVQSWRNGAHPFLSNCTSTNYSVLNIVNKTLGETHFSNVNDHSKWAVSSNKAKPVSCIGDLNRMRPQKTRGGVVVCIDDLQIWSAFKTIVEQTQPCNSTAIN